MGITLRVDGLKYNKENGKYSITLNGNDDSQDNIQFDIKNSSKIIKVDQGPFISDIDGGAKPNETPLENTAVIQSEHQIFTRRDKWFLFLWALYIIVAILVFMVIEGDDFIASFYFRIVTSFGVGYGDYTPQTAMGKLLNCVFIVIDLAKLAYIDWRIISILFTYKQHKYALDVMSTSESTPHPRFEDERLSQHKCSKIVNHQNFVKYILVLLSIFFLSGTFVMIFVEDYHWLDAIHWNFVTLSQVGYGDVIPLTVGGQIFTIFYIIFGYVLLVLLAVVTFDNYMAKIRIKKKAMIDGSNTDNNGVELTGLLSQ